ncbi:VOC family protein [Nocardioides sp. KIGAM211]|uniref:VOC family protein n=1 Tax=Nocardioides luti TaxID=2761101 RepID=A0A7X0RMM5_9ACTN|nr:VOC family protein [Nocardioides luti]MBB6629869.1 VOC family protein [Nocardioides luti]
MTLRLLALAVDAHDPARLAAFWAEVLGREVVDDGRGLLLPGTATQVGLRFVASTSERVGQNRVHLHLTSEALGDQRRTVDRLVALGGRETDVGQLPDEDHVVVADPEGNELCVIEAGNSYLAGCGFLGELACDGTREVGLFWAAALDWPLVWDQDEETAVQSPAGGTKVAWGGPPLAPRHGRDRQRFDLVADGVSAEVERLVGLGATRLEAPDARGEVVALADPDGNEFALSPA